MRHITAEQLHDLLQQEAPPPLLLDVREPQEYAYCHLEGSQHIPMQQIPARMTELEPDRTLVVICHHGMRSLQVAHYLESAGFNDVVNLDGGVDAWALQVDPSMPRYR